MRYILSEHIDLQPNLRQCLMSLCPLLANEFSCKIHQYYFVHYIKCTLHTIVTGVSIHYRSAKSIVTYNLNYLMVGHPSLGPCAKAAFALDVIIFNRFKYMAAVLEALSGLWSNDNIFLFVSCFNIDITTYLKEIHFNIIYRLKLSDQFPHGGSIEQKKTGSGMFISTPSISIDSSWVIFFDLDNFVKALFTALLLLESKSPQTSCNSYNISRFYIIYFFIIISISYHNTINIFSLRLRCILIKATLADIDVPKNLNGSKVIQSFGDEFKTILAIVSSISAKSPISISRTLHRASHCLVLSSIGVQITF
ncbi:hypothetical protein AGLY_007718 [Aphis glycines]|uniref:Uncharacterized protein n=1 Tax=Aphis glycines TaxID=307491 RepID=A0A6G0TND2_APHGL|nr:hypothetical protein AGLY_007718 [Aphis glycines]